MSLFICKCGARYESVTTLQAIPDPDQSPGAAFPPRKPQAIPDASLRLSGLPAHKEDSNNGEK